MHSQDYGPDDMFVYAEGECAEKQIDKYTYKVCAFGKATQAEGAGSTSLGTFSSFSHSFTVMDFDGVRI
jgi:protein kinase C substrate 80K-H